MDSSHSRVPVVVIANTAEAYSSFLWRINDSSLHNYHVRQTHASSDRALLWQGDSKLVIGSLPIFHLEYLNAIGHYYKHTKYCHPKTPSVSLCEDIRNDASVLKCLLNYISPHKTIHCIPYANTSAFFKLVEFLETCYNLTVLLPESPYYKNLWIKDYLDTKMGFRTLTSRWLGDTENVLPFGVHSSSLEEAVNIITWFLQRNCACIVKDNSGYLGLGQITVHPNALQQENFANHLLQQIAQHPYLEPSDLVIEEFIQSSQKQYPSAEFFVPPVTTGVPFLTYVCNQVFSKGNFIGVLISPEQKNASWYLTLINYGLIVAQNLQNMGFIGYFDVDAIVDDSENLYALEVNTRRTGATHVHEAACHLLGKHYVDNFTLLSRNSVKTKTNIAIDTLLECIDTLLFPMNSSNLKDKDATRKGIIITHSSNLPQLEFGYLIIAGSTQETMSIHQEMSRLIEILE